MLFIILSFLISNYSEKTQRFVTQIFQSCNTNFGAIVSYKCNPSYPFSFRLWVRLSVSGCHAVFDGTLTFPKDPLPSTLTKVKSWHENFCWSPNAAKERSLSDAPNFSESPTDTCFRLPGEPGNWLLSSAEDMESTKNLGSSQFSKTFAIFSHWTPNFSCIDLEHLTPEILSICRSFDCKH